MGPIDDGGRRQSRGRPPRRHRRARHLPRRLHALLDAGRRGRRAVGGAARLGEPAGRHRRRQPRRHRGGGDRRHEPLRRPWQRLFGPARHHRHPVDRQRADAARSVVVASLHDHRRRPRHRGHRRLAGPPLARVPTAAPEPPGSRFTGGLNHGPGSERQGRGRHRRGLGHRARMCEGHAGRRRPRGAGRPCGRQARGAVRGTRTRMRFPSWSTCSTRAASPA